MADEPDTPDDLARSCATSGFKFENLHRVREGVYRGTLAERRIDSSADAFVKIYPKKKREGLREFTRLATATGHPECHLIDSEYVCLIMGIAQGRSLSQLLPVVFLPGVWQLRKNRYKQAYFQVGKQLGRLHAETERGIKPILNEGSRDKALRRIKFLNKGVPNTTIIKTQELLEYACDIQAPSVLTYGDRSPHNIYFDGSNITQIDFGCISKNTVYDHASVLVGLRMMHSRLRYPATSIRTTLETEYWNGYAQTGIQPLRDKKSLAISCLTLYLSLLEFYQEDVNSLNARLTKRVDPPVIYREIQRTVENVKL